MGTSNITKTNFCWTAQIPCENFRWRFGQKIPRFARDTVLFGLKASCKNCFCDTLANNLYSFSEHKNSIFERTTILVKNSVKKIDEPGGREEIFSYFLRPKAKSYLSEKILVFMLIKSPVKIRFCDTVKT